MTQRQLEREHRAAAKAAAAAIAKPGRGRGRGARARRVVPVVEEAEKSFSTPEEDDCLSPYRK